MEAVVALCKRRGFVYQGSEIYGGLAGTWDYGPYGVMLKENIKRLWWKRFVENREDMYPVDAAIIMNPKAWEASGHVSGFSDPMVECVKCKRRFRADQLADKAKCSDCGGKLGEERQFNMMFRTSVGAMEDAGSTAYLRPETAAGMFVNFKNIIDSFHPKLPFGMAQVGKAFRNEIAPRDFLFRVREFEQMEIEYFVEPDKWEVAFEEFRKEMHEFMSEIGLAKEKIHELEVGKEELAHYSKRTIDIEYDYPFGRKELYGLAYRTDFDLTAHTKTSSSELSYYDDEKKARFTPHVVEPSFGLDRTILAVLLDAYTEDEMAGEKRVYLKFKPEIAPVRVAVFPLLKNKPELVTKAREVYAMLKKALCHVEFDDNGNIGKRYRRQDEIGTPYCVTVDFDTLGDLSAKGSAQAGKTELKDTVTLRDRDTGQQERVAIAELVQRIS